jgi:TonB family protein
MKTLFLFLFALSPSLSALAQADSSKSVEQNVFAFVEQMPEYPGGMSALMKFIQTNVVYPQIERDLGVQGKVIVRFVVMENGSVDSIKVVQKVSPLLDAQAIRVVKLFPKFKPGYQQGKAVRVYYNLPFVFRFDNESTPSDLKENKDSDFRNALSLIRYDEYEEAIKALHSSLFHFPDEYLAYEMRAECELKLHRKEDACNDYQKAKALGSPSADSLLTKHCN